MKSDQFQCAGASHPVTAILVVAVMFLGVSSPAATRTVTTLTDAVPGSLRTLISQSAANDVINFQPGLQGAINLTNGELVIGRNLTIVGPGASVVAVTTVQGTSILEVLTNATVTISGLTISRGANYGYSPDQSGPGGDAFGGGVINGGTLTLNGCNIVGNSVLGGDGGIMGGGGGTGHGGGIYNSGLLTLNSCLIASNTAVGGVDSGDLSGSGGSGMGGGIFNAGALTLSNCIVTANSAQGTAASGNAGLGFGGGIHSVGALALTGCTVSYNSALGGDGSAYMGSSTGSPGLGGGVYLQPNAPGPNELINCTIAGNSALGGLGDVDGMGEGGGIEDGAPGLSLLSCTISANSGASSSGSGSVSGGQGGGLDASAGNSLPTLENTLISGNSAQAAAGSGDSTGTGPDVDGEVNSGGFNFIGEADGSTGWSDSDLTGSVAAPFDPSLGPLQNNGGPTPTMALLSNSPAIDQGYSFGLTTDQRGAVRPFVWPQLTEPPGGDGSDIGAFEFTASQPVLALVPNLALGEMVLAWSENSPVTGPPYKMRPNFILEHTSGGISPGPQLMWAEVQTPVRWINNQFVAVAVNTGGNDFFQLTGLTTNGWFVAPPATLAAGQITTDSATLNGSDAPVGHNTMYWFEYGLDTTYGAATPQTSLATSTSTNQVALDYPLTGLGSSTAYHYQLVVMDDQGTQYGGDMTFTTAGLPPVVTTLAATGITQVSATLNGSINGNGGNWAAYFQYGLTTSYGSDTSANQTFGSGVSTQSVSNNITGLTQGTTYHYRMVGFANGVEGVGADATFTTFTAF